MKIDLRKLYSQKYLTINEEFIVPEEYYKGLDIIRMDAVLINGELSINHEGNIELTGELKGNFYIPCSISREEVICLFNTEVNEEISQKLAINQKDLDLLDILWENIVLEVPLKVIKEGIRTDNIKGEGWELEG